MEHVVRYWRRAVAGNHHVVYADKRHDSSRVDSTRVRKTLSWGFTTLVGSFFDLPVADTQTGCKVFRRDVLASVLPLLHEKGFSIDLELFVAAHAIGFHDFVGAPVHIGERLAGSSVGSSAVVRTLRESLSVLGRLRFGHAYGRVPVVPMAVVHELPTYRPAGHLDRRAAPDGGLTCASSSSTGATWRTRPRAARRCTPSRCCGAGRGPATR